VRSRYRRYARKPPVAIFTRFEHIDDTLATAHIDAAALATDIRLAARSIARTNSTQLFAY
jgi:hypothetical protein